MEFRLWVPKDIAYFYGQPKSFSLPKGLYGEPFCMTTEGEVYYDEDDIYDIHTRHYLKKEDGMSNIKLLTYALEEAKLKQNLLENLLTGIKKKVFELTSQQEEDNG